ncbi:helix-turn-helix domain-containing protein [Embleya sp. NBC_00888]|uniref:helix-turn-helix domain-containing protein n=1 Tax=Embleya sp. NBC_00888 TaxID=2975960 RepID=UPI003863AC4A|nr:helix-turn-helix domain-containing protein [Embleya sp. NBC_00888]
MTDKAPKPRKLLTVPQAAERLNVKERYVRRLISERRITFVRLGRHVRVPVDAVDALIGAGTVQPLLPRSAQPWGRAA